MVTTEQEQKVQGWFAGRLPQEWTTTAPLTVSVDKEEITVLLSIADSADDEVTEAYAAEERAGRARAFREETRDARIAIAREAEHRYERKVSWGVRVGDYDELWTHVAAPVMTRLRQPERRVLDTLVDAGVARSRSEALAWCVRLVAQHEDDWLAELRQVMESVADVRAKGPAA